MINYGSFYANVVLIGSAPLVDPAFDLKITLDSGKLLALFSPQFYDFRFAGAAQCDINTGEVGIYRALRDVTSNDFETTVNKQGGGYYFANRNTSANFTFIPNFNYGGGVFPAEISKQVYFPSSFNGGALHSTYGDNAGYSVAFYIKSYTSDYEAWSLDSSGQSHYFGFLNNGFNPFDLSFPCVSKISNYPGNNGDEYDRNQFGGYFAVFTGGVTEVNADLTLKGFNVINSDCVSNVPLTSMYVFGSNPGTHYGTSFIRSTYIAGGTGNYDFILINIEGDTMGVRLTGLVISGTLLQTSGLLAADGTLYACVNTSTNIYFFRVDLPLTLPQAFKGRNIITNKNLSGLVNFSRPVSVLGAYKA